MESGETTIPYAIVRAGSGETNIPYAIRESGERGDYYSLHYKGEWGVYT